MASSLTSGRAARWMGGGAGAGADGVDTNEMVAGGAGIDEGEVGRDDKGEPAEGAGRAMAVGGVEGEHVVGAAVGAGGRSIAAAFARRPGSPAVGRATTPGRRGTWIVSIPVLGVLHHDDRRTA